MIYLQDPDVTVHQGDVLECLAELADGSVDCVVTSPPYWGLRDYGIDGQLGLEATPDLYLQNMVNVFRQARRVLAPHGTCWLNIGDSYHGGGGGNYGTGLSSTHGQHLTNVRNRIELPGLKPKDLCGIPWRLALALQADGWWLRAEIIWAKPNPMPESVTDRPTKAHEQVFLLTKAPRYFFDQDAVRDPISENWKVGGGPTMLERGNGFSPDGRHVQTRRTYEVAKGRNLRTVWEIPTQPYPEAHFATFPEALVERCLKAGCKPGGVVLDPFLGSGTTAHVARKHGYRAIGIELNEDYCRLAARRLAQLSLLAEGAA